MAIYFAGYLSPIKNKLGNAVGRKWRTLDVLSAYNGHPRNPHTTAQQIQRGRFGVAATLAGAFGDAVMLGFEAVCKGTKTPQKSYFIKKNWPNIVSDTPGTVTIDYAELVIAQGTLVKPQMGSPTFTEPLEVAVTNTDNSGTGNAKATDYLYAFVYSIEAKAGILSTGNKRADASVTVNVPDYWNGHRVHVWGFAYGDPSSDNAGLVSGSSYLGSGTIS